MLRLSWKLKLLTILCCAVATLVGGAFARDDEYMRYTTLDDTIQNRVRWVYERIHFDPAPVDIVVIGPSRTEAGVSAPRLESDLAQLGHPVRAVNFSLPEAGRDLNWVLLKETLKTKTPRLIIIGVTEKPSRFGHPAYKYIASPSDIVDPAYFGNINYLSNLLYLPYRQVRLAIAKLLPGLFNLPTYFDSQKYAGSNVETTVTFVTGNGITVDRGSRVSRNVLLAKVAKYEAGVRPPLLGTKLRDVEFGDERIYLTRIVRLAHMHNVRVAFLFMPYYTGPNDMQEGAFYASLGTIIVPSFVRMHDEWYSDAAHLNHAGALVLTDWLATRAAALL